MLADAEHCSDEVCRVMICGTTAVWRHDEPLTTLTCFQPDVLYCANDIHTLQNSLQTGNHTRYQPSHSQPQLLKLLALQRRFL